MLTLLSLTFSLFLFVFLFTILSSMHTAMFRSNIQLNILAYSTSYDMKNQNLPQSYIPKITSLAHVKAASPCLMAFSYFKEFAKVINLWGVEFTDIREFRDIGDISNDTLSRVTKERTAALVGENIMNLYGWQVGDRIILKSRVKGVEIPITIRGVMSPYGEGGNLIFLNLPYIQDLMGNPGRLSWISIKVEDPSFMPEVSREVENMFRNYPVEVTTVTERGFMNSIVENIKAILIAFNLIGWITIISTFFLVINSLTMSIRERTTEIGVMRALGFTKGKILGLMITESILITVIGGMIGSFLAYLLLSIPHINIPTGMILLQLIPNFNLVWYGLLISILIGFFASIFPVLNSTRKKVGDAIRSIG